MRNPFKTQRIDFVFFFGFAFIVTVLVGVVVWISYSSSSNEIAANTSYYQQKLLGELNKKLTTSLVGIEQSSNTASNNFNLFFNRYREGTKYDKARAQAEIRSQLNNYVFNTPILESIHVYSALPQNYNLQEYVQFLPFDQVEEESWYALIDKSDVAWITEHTIRSNKGDIQVISFARKVYNNLNQYHALMVLNIKVPVFRELIETEDSDSSLALLDETGQLITQTVSEAFGREQLDRISLEMEADAVGAIRSGNEFLVWSKSIDSKWTLIERTSWKEMTASSLKMTRLFLLLGIAAIAMILLLGLIVSRQFMKPIGLLLKAMSNYSMQKAGVLPDDYKNEFGRLFQGYQKLINRIEELYGNLEIQYEKRREAEIKSLQVMINPHFLYNSLDQVNWMAITAGQPKISAMLSQLGQLFRLALTNTNSLVPLAEEVAHIECYLQFQQIRWEDRLQYRIEADESTLSLFVPKIILQPFIENAFVHGFHGRRNAELTVKMEPVDGHLEIVIEDDGRGMQDEAASRRSAKGGYGLRNVKERIEALFGPEYGFELVERESAGTRVIIRLPIIHENAQEEGS